VGRARRSHAGRPGRDSGRHRLGGRGGLRLVHHFGGFLVTPGYTDPIKFADGNPYGTSHVAGQGDIPVDDLARSAAAYQGRRVAAVTAQLLSGRAALVS
jgi:hypothetical protein